MISMTRLAIGAGLAAAASVSLGAGAASAAPCNAFGETHRTAAASGKWEIWDYYTTDEECDEHGADGQNDDRWYAYQCHKGIGKYQNSFGLYVKYRAGKGAPTDPHTVPYYYSPPPGTGDGDDDDGVDNGDTGENPPVGGRFITP